MNFASALFVFLFALIFVQCIFVVNDTAFAEQKEYEELISDYFSFSAPTHVAAGDGIVAVFDRGQVVLFRGDSRTVFPVEVTECNKMCVSAQGVFLLSGVSEEEETTPELHVYTLSGQAKALALPMAGVTDIALSGTTLYTLSSETNLRGYSAEDGTQLSLFVPGKKYLFHLAAEGEDIYLISLLGRVFRKAGDELLSPEEKLEGNEAHFSLFGGNLFFEKEGSIYAYGASRFLEKERGTGDALFSRAIDFAFSDGLLYLLDGNNLAVKIYDAETKAYRGMIGSFGKDLGRLDTPVALDVSDGKVVVADSARVSVFTAEGARPLNGRAVTDPTDVVFAGESVFLADEGILWEYVGGSAKDHGLGEGACRYVAAAPDGTVYASSGREVYCKKPDESFFKLLLTEEKTVEGLHVGIGGQVFYVLAGGSLRTYSSDGVCLRTLMMGEKVTSFAVDYRGNVFFLSGKRILRYARTLDGYLYSSAFSLPSSYGTFSDFTFAADGRSYVIADHNVLIYSKEALGVFVASDSDFKDTAPALTPRFVCEVTKDRAIAYVAPDNFEDISSLSRGTKLMGYAIIAYGGDEYVRAETQKGTVYIASDDVKIFEAGDAPISRARCLISAIWNMQVGVDLYEEPSHIAVAAGAEPLFKGLGENDIFNVISYVATDEDGADVWGFYCVEYQGKTAYVLIDEVVSVDDEPIPMPTTYYAKVRSDGLGKRVAVYKEASKNSEVVARLTDGAEIRTLEKINKSKEFTAVLYDGEVRYVLSANLGQGGLSGGQILAIVLSVAAAIGSVLTILILRANKRHKRYYKE